MDIQEKEWGSFVEQLKTKGVVKIGRNALGVITNLVREGSCSLGYNDIELMWETWQAAKAQAVPEGFGLFDGDTLTYSSGYSINCGFDDEFDCHVFDVSKDGCYIKTGMTQLEQAHCFVLSMIKLDAKDSTLEAQESAND
ncbi:hypothetical protein [Acinetobacter sp. BSP-28]|uniref:hypothetical protein n=1 Tax=Acinetobacter sp. BSP-28 TaxID=3344661 RepID=UPI0037705F40